MELRDSFEELTLETIDVVASFEAGDHISGEDGTFRGGGKNPPLVALCLVKLPMVLMKTFVS